MAVRNQVRRKIAEKSSLLQESYKTLVSQKSKKDKKQFLQVPFSERIILLPQCLRNIEKCEAKDAGNRYKCQECGACKIGKIIKRAKILGYKGVFVLKGGRAIVALIEQIHPRAILGVACYYEGLIGMTECENRDIPVQFVSLTRDGCVNTDVDLSDLEDVINLKVVQV